MSAQSAPSLRSRLPVLAFTLETILVLLFVFFVKVDHHEPLVSSYAEFQDVHVMVFLGFGFLASFLVRYGFSGSGFHLLSASLAIQFAVLLNGFLLPQRHHPNHQIYVDLKSIVEAEMCAASGLVAMGAIHGKINPVQVLLLTLLEVTGFVVNQWIVRTLLNAEPRYSIMSLHVFGSLFGMMASWVLHRDGTDLWREKEKSSYKNTLFSMLGTLFMWMFWPSFNSALVSDRWDSEVKLSIIYGTYLSLSVSVVTAMAVSVSTSAQGKVNMIHVQSSVLSAGVAIGVAVTAVNTPWVAMVIGCCAALLSGLGFRFMKSRMLSAFECHDTCGVLYTHAAPGILGWVAHLLLRLWSLENTIALNFAVHHVCVLLVTVSMSLVMGIITGLLLKSRFWRAQPDRKCFDDQAFWEFPHLAVQK